MNNKFKKLLFTVLSVFAVVITFVNINNSNVTIVKAATLEATKTFDQYIQNDKATDPTFAQLVNEFLADSKWSAEKKPEIAIINLARYAASKGKLAIFLGSTYKDDIFSKERPAILSSLKTLIATGNIQGNPNNPNQKNRVWSANKLQPLKWSNRLQGHVNSVTLAPALQKTLVHSPVGKISNSLFISNEAVGYGTDLLQIVRDWIMEENNINVGWGHRTHVLQESTQMAAVSSSQSKPEYGGKSFVFQTGNEIGWFSKNNNWYFNDDSAHILKYFHKIANKWYYFDSNGVRQKGVKKIANKWYYFDNNGVRQTGFKKIANKGYYFDNNGIRQTGFKKIANKWYYFDSNGVKQIGSKKLANKWYLFDRNGVRQTGWRKVNNRVYYYKSNGQRR